jgi:hypothetical protein
MTLVALAVCAALTAPSPAQAQAAPSAQLETEVLVPPQGGAADVPLHVGKVCVLSFPDKLDHRAIASSLDFELKKWSESTLAVRADRDSAAPVTIALATIAGLKVNVTLRVVPATEPAPTMVRFRALSEAQLLEARVAAEVAKHLGPAQHRLGQAQHRLEQAQRQLASAQAQLTEERQHLLELTRRREPETTLALQLTRGLAVLWEAGTEASAEVDSRGVAASASFGVRPWLDLGGELGVAYLDEARYRRATLPLGGTLFTGPLRRTTNTAQLRGFATLRVGYLWTPFLQLALGAGARFRSTAAIYVPTAQGLLWLPPDDQGEEVSLDLVTGVRAGIERRVTVRWTAGISATAAHAFGVSTPDLRTSEVTFSLSYAPFGP